MEHKQVLEEQELLIGIQHQKLVTLQQQLVMVFLLIHQVDQ
jgi:hypothetical protein